MKRDQPFPTTESKDPITILKTVIKAIKDEPKRYNQADWIATIGEGTANSDYERDQWPFCGTIGCVAAWTCMVTGNDLKGMPFYKIAPMAQNILRLDLEDREELFSGTAVEERCAKEGGFEGDALLVPDQGSKEYAKVGIKNIKAFVMKKWGVRL